MDISDLSVLQIISMNIATKKSSYIRNYKASDSGRMRWEACYNEAKNKGASSSVMIATLYTVFWAVKLK